MTRSTLTFSLVCLLAGGLLLPGCGGGTETPTASDTIKPAAEEPEAPEPAEAEEEPEEVVQSDAAPAEEPMPEEPAPEVAETPAEPEPADEPEPETASTEPADTPEPAAEVEETATRDDGTAPTSVTLGGEAGGTTFKGRVTVAGDATEPAPFEASKDPFCIGLGKLPDDNLVIGDDGGLANVFVWLRSVPSGAEVPEAPQEAVVLDNVKCNFAPHAFVLRVGQPMLVKNADDTAHNTRISPTRNNAFNQTIGPNDRSGVEVVYNLKELVPIKTQCDIHPWMGNFHFPVDHPWACVTDENGNFEISGLPAGDLVFTLWHEKTGYVEKKAEVTIGDGETLEQSFSVDAADLAE